MTFKERVKKIDTAALRAHPAFPLIVIGWMVLLFGAAAYIVKGGALYALLGAIAGGLVGRYIVTRVADGQGEPEGEDRPETERDKRLRRVLGPDSDEEPAAPQAVEDDNPDADLERILASRESKPAPIFENGDREFLDDKSPERAEAPDIPEAPAIEDESEPQYLTIEELQLEEADEVPAVEPQRVENEVGAGDDGEDDGSDDFGPPESPEWSDPGAALAAMRNSNQQGSVDWEQYSRGSEPENAYDAYEGWTVDAVENAGEESAADGDGSAEAISDPHPHVAVASEPLAEPQVAPQAETEPEPEPQPESAGAAQLDAGPGENAVAKLRSQDLSEMSLVQMIERLAFAMDDYREMRDRKLAMGTQTAAEPDPAVAEALRALPALSRTAGVYATDGNAALDLSTREEAEATEDALREALEKLQRLSGG